MNKATGGVPCSAFYLDSMSPLDEVGAPTLPPVALAAYLKLKAFIMAQAQLRALSHGIADSISMKRPLALRVPQQDDEVSCGAFLLWFVRQIIQRASSFYDLPNQVDVARCIEAIIARAGEVDIIDVRQSIYRELYSSGTWHVSNAERNAVYDRIRTHEDWGDMVLPPL